MKLSLKSSISALPGIGSRTKTYLARIGVETLEDLIFYFPVRYEDLSTKSTISDLIPGKKTSVSVSLWQVKTFRARSGKFLTKAVLADSTGTIEATWFNQPYLEKNLKASPKITLAGTPTFYQGKLGFLSPAFEKSDDNSLHTSRLVPVYSQIKGLSSKFLRSKIRLALDLLKEEIREELPAHVIKQNQLEPIKDAIEQIHFPKNFERAEKARQRFAFEELLNLQLASLERKRALSKQKVGQLLHIDKTSVEDFISKLPFKLTRGQIKVLNEIISDLGKMRPMNRLLQGDVGCGKTIVAAIAAFMVAQNGFKTLFMAPTEILAKQHYVTIENFFSSTNFSIGLATSSKKINPSESDLIVGTHALLNLNLPVDRIGLVIIDEQHRFGVAQREELLKKALRPHLLTISATPIPRTLAIVALGDLDISVLDELPKGRKTPRTFLVPPEKRLGAYQFIKKHAKNGELTFIVCPFIETSESQESVKSVKKEWDYLQKEVFPEYKIGLLHGRMRAREKDRVTSDFKKGSYRILVSTPIVEVGIDIPKATIILIEGAERFGLASLHQLRGRVGRGDKASFCLLFTDSENPRILERLKNMEKLTSGFALAQADLRYRGPGEIFGTLQHGLPTLRIAHLSDTLLIEKARQTAALLIGSEGRSKHFGRKGSTIVLS